MLEHCQARAAVTKQGKHRVTRTLRNNRSNPLRGFFAAAIAAICLLAHDAPTSQAGWLSKLAREAGDAGGTAGRVGLSSLDNAAGLIKKLPEKPGALALAAHATPEGHWKFVNRDGEVFTAATPEEMERVIPSLAPDVAASGRQPDLSLYLSEASVFDKTPRLDDLPGAARLHIVVGRDSFRLRSAERSGQKVLQASVRPNVVVPLTNRADFDEAIWQLGRRLNRADIRVLALEPGGPEALMSAPRFQKGTGAALVDRVDPDRLAGALSGIPGQTVLLTGRVDDRILHFAPASGGARSLSLKDLKVAAAANDVNLVVLQSAAPRQPGGRNWLWQTVEVEGLKDAVKRATFADFLNALASTRAQMSVTATPQSAGRVVIEAIPTGTSALPLGDVIGPWFTDAISSVTGNVVTSAITADVNSRSRQSELDMRLIPGLPSWIQFLYLGAMVIGLMGLGVARSWWAYVWKPEVRQDYTNALGFHAARVVKFLVFMLVFLPVVGIPAFVAGIAMQAYAILTAPFRFVGWLFSRARAS